MMARNSRQKHQRQCSNDVDRISNLPESILSHILSLLPTTKEAVATSCLSTRWRFVWRNIHNLIFNDTAKQLIFDEPEQNIGKDVFEDFVNNVLLFLGRKCIDKFSLEINEYRELDYVTSWIDAAVSMNVKVLEFSEGVSMPSDARYFLHSSLFTCKTLEVLKLDGSIIVNVPNSVFLPSLKTLYLEHVIYQSDECVTNLISGCPLLDTLFVFRTGYDNVLTFTIRSPTLRNLTFKCHDEWSSFAHEIEYKLEINAPALIYLKLVDLISRDFYVENLGLLDKAKVVVYIDESLHYDEGVVDYDRYYKAVVKLIEGLYNVKNLSLGGETMKALSHVGKLTSFPRLFQLTVGGKCCEWNSLLHLIEGSNNLEFLIFSMDSCYTHKAGKCWRKAKIVPICLLSRLKTMSIHGLVGTKDEVSMVAYVLKNAKVLRTMTISVRNHRSIDTKARSFLQKVPKFPRGSEDCEIIFCDGVGNAIDFSVLNCDAGNGYYRMVGGSYLTYPGYKELRSLSAWESDSE